MHPHIVTDFDKVAESHHRLRRLLGDGARHPRQQQNAHQCYLYQMLHGLFPPQYCWCMPMPCINAVSGQAFSPEGYPTLALILLCALPKRATSFPACGAILSGSPLTHKGNLASSPLAWLLAHGGAEKIKEGQKT